MLVDEPRSISKPAFKLGVPVKFEFKVNIVSEISTFVEFIFVVVPSTIKSPFITTVPLISPSAGWGSIVILFVYLRKPPNSRLSKKVLYYSYITFLFFLILIFIIRNPDSFF